MPQPPPHAILERIQARLNQDAAATQVIEELLPHTRAEALTWAQRLTGWDEFRGQHPDQAIGIVRSISQRSLREFSLILNQECRIIDKPAERGQYLRPEPSQRFRLPIQGEEVCVAYTPTTSGDSTAGIHSISPAHTTRRGLIV